MLGWNGIARRGEYLPKKRELPNIRLLRESTRWISVGNRRQNRYENGKALQDGDLRSRRDGSMLISFAGKNIESNGSSRPDNAWTSVIIFRRDTVRSCQSNKYSVVVLFVSRFVVISWDRRSRNVSKWLSYTRIIATRGSSLCMWEERHKGYLSETGI